MRVKLLKKRYLEINGQTVHFQPGEWVDVPNKKIASDWVRLGVAVLADPIPTPVAGGVVSMLETLRTGGLPLTKGGYELHYEKTALIQVDIGSEKIRKGLALLGKWQIAIPMLNYETLASGIGTEEERDLTKSIIHDLRVPLYNPRVMFINKCHETEMLMAALAAEEGRGESAELALLRALYQVKPLLLPLPTSWGSHD